MSTVFLIHFCNAFVIYKLFVLGYYFSANAPAGMSGFFLDKRRCAMDENNKIDEMLEYPDFDRLEKSNLRNLSKGTIRISKKHLKIYIITIFVSLVFIVPYAFCNQGKWASIGMSIGASGVGAAILGLFIELAVKSEERKKYIFSYNSSILQIYHNLWEIFANRLTF